MKMHRQKLLIFLNQYIFSLRFIKFFSQNLYKDDCQLCYNRMILYIFLFMQNVCKMAINGFSHYIQCIYKVNLMHINVFLGKRLMKKEVQ